MSAPHRAGARRGPLALLLVAVLAAVAGCSSSSAQERAPEQVAEQEVGLEVGGRERSYLLKPATGLASGEEAAVVVVLHQEGGTPDGVADETALAGLRAQGATLVYPAGVDTSWDAGACCGVPSREKVDDVAFLDAVIEDVAERTAVDRQRVAMVGYSSGGMLTYRYVCARPGALAAAVVVSGSLESPCGGGIEVPHVLTLHGKLDGTIGLEQSRFIRALGLSPKPVNKTLGTLTSSAGCAAPRLEKQSDLDVYRWTGCRGGTTVEARIVADAGHGWGALSASERTQEFLRARLLS